MQVSAGALHTCCVAANSSLVCWGANMHGQVSLALALARSLYACPSRPPRSPPARTLSVTNTLCKCFQAFVSRARWLRVCAVLTSGLLWLRRRQRRAHIHLRSPFNHGYRQLWPNRMLRPFLFLLILLVCPIPSITGTIAAKARSGCSTNYAWDRGLQAICSGLPAQERHAVRPRGACSCMRDGRSGSLPKLLRCRGAGNDARGRCRHRVRQHASLYQPVCTLQR